MSKQYIFTILLIFLTTLVFSQIEEDIKTEQSRDTVRLIKETSDGTMIIELSDLEDLSDNRIDSLIQILELKTSVDSSNIYGHSLFKNKFELIDDEVGRSIVKTPNSYILGIGDEISISIFGTSQFLGKYIVDSKGFIYPEDMPSIFLFGLELGQAKQVIRKAFSRYFIFRSDQIAISLGAPRDIVVNIFGEVKKPGSYNISALNTSFQALYNAGGPNEKGSVRNIKVITDGFESRLDIYKLMVNPNSNADLVISENTLINIPVAEKVVRIEGAINRPMSYELLTDEGLKELIQYAGGLSSEAYLKTISVRRYDVDKLRVIDVQLEPIIRGRSNFKLQNGDVITIKKIANILQDVVYINGAVKHPGVYELSTTPKIKNLLERAELVREARKDLIFLKRTNDDGTTSVLQVNGNEVLANEGSSNNLLLEHQDEIVVDSLSRFVDKSTIKVSGAVRHEIEHSYDASGRMTVRSALNLAGGTLSDAADQAFILRTNPNNNTEKEYIRVDIKEVLDLNQGKADVALLPDDELIVLSNSESDDIKLITISGSVRIESELAYAKNLQIRDAIMLAGGLQREASGVIDVYRNTYEAAASIFRTEVFSVKVDTNYEPENAGSFALRPGDKLVARKLDHFESKAFVTIQGEVNQTGQFALIKNNETVSELLTRAGGLTSEAFGEGASILRDSTKNLVLNLKKALANTSSASNYILKDGDQIVVPKIENIVYVDISNTQAHKTMGQDSLQWWIGVPYEEGKSASWYLESFAGGPANFVEDPIEYVQSPNGGLSRSQKKLWLFKKQPKVNVGSTVGYISDKNSSALHTANEQSRSFSRLRKGVIINIDKEAVEVDEDTRLEKGQLDQQPFKN